MTGGYGNYSSTSSACNKPRISEDEAKSAAIDLARLMERQLGWSEGHINPIALRLFILAYWSRVSKFAHTIHDQNCA